MRVLVTGGAGFIGSHLVNRLVHRGESVLVLDNLDPQVHATAEPANLREDEPSRAALLDGRLHFVHGDVRNHDDVAAALQGADAVVHLAATVGVGQSMYKPSYYTDTNVAGLGVVLEQMLPRREQIRKFIVASSMSIYGEGAYRCGCTGGQVFFPTWGRNPADLERRDFDFHCPRCMQVASPVPTPESKTLHATSVYALTKKQQEELALCFGAAYGIPTLALRFFNVYGSRQSLSNPYTGAAAIFMSRLKNGRRPLVFEDGRQPRDFIHVHDVADAVIASLDAPAHVSGAYNVCTGRATSILELATMLADAMGRADIQPEIVRQYRAGDIRACIGDPSGMRDALGWTARVSLEDGLCELLEWARNREAVDRVEQATRELESAGLVR